MASVMPLLQVGSVLPMPTALTSRLFNRQDIQCIDYTTVSHSISIEIGFLEPILLYQCVVDYIHSLIVTELFVEWRF